MQHRSNFPLQGIRTRARGAALPAHAPGEGFRFSKASADTTASNKVSGISAAARLASTCGMGRERRESAGKAVGWGDGGHAGSSS